MDKVVVYGSVAIKWFVVELHTAEALRVLDAYKAGALSLAAPEMIHAEVGNVVWKKNQFQGLATADAEKIIDLFRALKLELTPTAALLEDAFRLAVANQRSVYDAMYLALSVREGCPLVTADEKLVNAVGSRFPGLVLVRNWP